MSKKGYKMTEEHKRKIGLANSIALKGKTSGVLGKHWKLSKPGRKNISEGHRGEKSYLWKGGITSLTQQIRHNFKYRQWRSDIFTRDNFTCVICGVRSGIGKTVYLEADHYPKSFSQIFQESKVKTLEEALNYEEFWNINNGRTVCKQHNPRGKRFKF